MSSGLEGTTAIVTGAGRVGEGIGNGRAAATRLAESGVSRHVIPIMTAGDGGSIIDMSSLTGPRGGHAGITYATTKGAVLSLTQAMAAYHCQQGIRVNAVAPGMVYTPMVASKDAVDDAFGAARTSLNVLGTEGRAWDVAEAVVWLAGPGSRWVSGIVLPVDASAASFSSAIQASITDAGATISGQDVETGAS